MPKKEVGSEIKDKIAKVCREVVPKEEILKLKAEIQTQLAFHKKRLDQLTGSLATINVILSRAKLEEASKKTNA